MHIAFFNRLYFPDQTATGQLLTDLCEDLVRIHGCRVSVVAGVPLTVDVPPRRGQRGIVTRETHNGVAILRAHGTRFAKARFSGRATNYVTYFLSACWAGLELDRPDVVVALTDPPIIGLAALAAARRFDAPLVMAFKDLFPEVAALLGDFHSPTINAALQQVNRYLVRRAAMNLALGETMRRRLIENKGAPEDRTAVIPDWADTSAIAPGPKRNSFSIPLGLDRKFVVMHSGNLGLSQNLETLVDAAALLRDVPDIQLVFQGEGVKKVDLERKVALLGLTNVTFLPYAPRATLSDAFASADLFVVSLQQGLAGYIVPSKLYGILAAGRPFVAAVDRTCEVTALTEAHDCGTVVAPGDARVLADAIAAFHRDRARLATCGTNARALGLQFERGVQVAKYERLFRRLVSAAGKSSRARRSARAPQPFAARQVAAGYGIAKRAFDIALAGAGLLMSLPIWIVVALAIRIEDGGAVFYGQERVGRRGRVFRVLKFRLMVPDAEAVVGAVQSSARDPRVTRVGHLMRPTALDELPQLWNILRGDMSFVGPRALRPGEIEAGGSGALVKLEDIPGFAERCQVAPGLTGVAQIFAPRDIPRRQKFRYDALYIRRQSFWLDVRLVLLSLWITCRGTWETRGEKF